MKVQEAVCDVCMHRCRLASGAWGICRARKNENGNIVCANYGQITSLALDPIEKKPLRRFMPGSMILSVGSYGCNLRCPFCQNHEISMAGKQGPGSNSEPEQERTGTANGAAAERETCRMVETEYFSPERLCELAIELRGRGNIGVAFTYNEPLISYEYVLDTSKLLREAGLKSVLVTNGTVLLPILEKLLPYVDAMNIDLKGFSEQYYRKLGGDFETVKAVIVRAAENCHIELTTLIVPGENDTVEEMEQEADFIASISPEIPLHISRFFPRYRMTDREATDVALIYRLAEIARGRLRYVYTGNC